MEDRRSRERNLVVKGVKDGDSKESEAAARNVLSALKLADEDVRYMRRIGARKDKMKDRHIIITLRSGELRDRLLEHKREILEKHAIKIDQDLTKLQQENLSTIYKEASDRNDKLGTDPKFKWTVKGPRSNPFLGKRWTNTSPT